MKKLSANPSKSEELEFLADITASLPDNSYLKPWLRAVQQPVADYLRSDIVPMDCDPVTVFRLAREQAESIVAMARRQADAIEGNAKSLAKDVIAEADAYYARQRAVIQNAKGLLQSTAERLTDVARLI